MDLDYYKLPWYKKILHKVKNFFKGIGYGFVGFWVKLWKAVVSFFKGLGKLIKEFFVNFGKGNFMTKVSYFIMGFGHLFRGQTLRGIIYLVLQILFVLYITLFGGTYISMFFESFGKSRNPFSKGFLVG